MLTTALGRSVSPSAWALFALLACGLVVPSKARAGCSFYVLSQSDRDHPAFLDPLLLGADGDSGEHPSPSPSNGPRPCSGAFCSGEPSTPPTPPSSVSPQVKPWACLAIPEVPTGCRLTPFLLDASDSRPVRAGDSIFHPPRLSPSASLRCPDSRSPAGALLPRPRSVDRRPSSRTRVFRDIDPAGVTPRPRSGRSLGPPGRPREPCAHHFGRPCATERSHMRAHFRRRIST